jgi:hypothetical protein
MPYSASAFPKLCSLCDMNLSQLVAGSELVLASSQPGYTSRTTRGSNRPGRVSGPLYPGAALDQCDVCCPSGGSGVGLVASGV